MALSRPMIWIRNTVLILVIIAFVAIFGQPRGRAVSGMVADVNGEMIRRDTFEFFRSQLETRAAESLPADMDRGQLSDLLDRQTLATLIQRSLLAQQARALGLAAPDPELAEVILSEPEFQGTDGVFSRDRFETFWRRAGFDNDRGFTEERRRDLLIAKLQRLVTDSVRISDARAREELEREKLEVRIRYTRVRPEQFAQEGAPSQAEIEAFARENAERIQQAYQARIDEFRKPEEIRARHILFIGDKRHERAAEAAKRLGAGEDFAALARELSDDEATRDAGGELGFFPRGRMLAAFENAAFALEPGQVSPPVETERGVHLIQLEQRQAALSRSLEDATPELARELLRQDRSGKAAVTAANQLLTQIQSGQPFESAARVLGLEVEQSPAFGPQDPTVPGIGRVPGLKEAALALSMKEPNAKRVFSDGHNSFVIALIERQAPDPEALQAELGSTRERLEQQAVNELLGRWVNQRRQQLQQSGKLVQFPLSSGR